MTNSTCQGKAWLTYCHWNLETGSKSLLEGIFRFLWHMYDAHRQPMPVCLLELPTATKFLGSVAPFRYTWFLRNGSTNTLS